jgi:hypothetical protein
MPMLDNLSEHCYVFRHDPKQKADMIVNVVAGNMGLGIEEAGAYSGRPQRRARASQSAGKVAFAIPSLCLERNDPPQLIGIEIVSRKRQGGGAGQRAPFEWIRLPQT